MPEGPMREDFVQPGSSNADPAEQPPAEERLLPVAQLGVPQNSTVHTRRTLLTNTYFRAAERYSDELKNLVRRCLNFEQRNRPSLEDLYNTADAQITASQQWRDDIEDVGLLMLDLPGGDDWREFFAIDKPVPARRNSK